MICASIILLIGHLTFGIVYLTMLFCLIQLTCKSRLDKFWQHQDLIYDFKAEISGTGSRSCYQRLVLFQHLYFILEYKMRAQRHLPALVISLRLRLWLNEVYLNKTIAAAGMAKYDIARAINFNSKFTLFTSVGRSAFPWVDLNPIYAKYFSSLVTLRPKRQKATESIF